MIRKSIARAWFDRLTTNGFLNNTYPGFAPALTTKRI